MTVRPNAVRSRPYYRQKFRAGRTAHRIEGRRTMELPESVADDSSPAVSRRDGDDARSLRDEEESICV